MRRRRAYSGILSAFISIACLDVASAQTLEEVRSAAIAARDRFFAGKIVADITSEQSVVEEWTYAFGPSGSLSVANDASGASKSFALDINKQQATEVIVPKRLLDKPMKVYDQSGLFAVKHPPTPHRPNDKVPWLLMRSIRRSAVGDHYTLEEVFQWDETQISSSTGEGIVVSTAFPPEEGGDSPSGPDTIKLVLDSARGYSIVKSVVNDHFKDDAYPPLEYSLNTSHHQEMAPGIWLPKLVQLSVKQGGKPIPMGWTAKLTYSDVNVVPKPDEVRVSPPENTVMWVAGEDGTNSALLYGANGEVVKEFDSEEEVSAYRMEVAETEGVLVEKADYPRRIWLAGLNLLVLVVLLSIYLYRRASETLA